MIFETERFFVRRLRLEDLEDFYGMQSNDNVMRYIKPPLNYEESVKELKKFIGYYEDDARYFMLWAIESKSDHGFVGLCGVYHNDEKENEIAYRLRERYWGKGFGREVVKELISYCLETADLGEIVAFADEDNVGSVRILDGEMEFVERVYSVERERYSKRYVL